MLRNHNSIYDHFCFLIFIVDLKFAESLHTLIAGKLAITDVANELLFAKRPCLNPALAETKPSSFSHRIGRPALANRNVALG